MKAITIWQPWASLLAYGAKQYETRSWATNYRGPIAIHAAAKPVWQSFNGLILGEKIYEAIRNEIIKIPDNIFPNDLPTGCIIAIAELINCWRIVYNPGTNIDIAKNIPIGAELDVPRNHPNFHRYIVPTEREMLFGDWTPGHYAWEFANMTLLPNPIPAKGYQRLWEWRANK